MEQPDRKPGLIDPAIYEIRIRGWLGESWSGWLEEKSLVAEQGEDGTVTIFTCAVPDQAALMGLLRELYNLGLSLLSVNRVG